MRSRREGKFSKIVAAATVSGTAGRDYLSGVFEYTNAGKRWTLEIADNISSLDERLSNEDRPDGVIIMIPHRVLTLATLRKMKTPTVIVDFPPEGFPNSDAPISFVRLDDTAIGRAAAEHLLSRGNFNAFACVIDEPQFKYPAYRERGFRERLGASSKFIKTLILPDLNVTKREIEDFQLRFSRLPRPLGVFAVRDRAALKVFDVCRRFGFIVPDEIAIVGVDNDELFCNTTPIPLSSVFPNHRQIGILAARELNRLLHKGRGVEKVFEKSVKEVVLRASTRIVPPTARIVADILAYIEGNASGSLRVADVTAKLSISRRLADLRFRQIQGETILDAIVRARMGKAKKRLLTTSDSISRIANDCGFGSASAFTRFFKAHSGKTPLAWRESRE